VDADDIAWKKIQPGSARMTSRELSVHRGPVDAWLFRGGELQRRFRMILIGNDAGIQLECGDSDREGVLTFHGWGLDSISTLSDMQQTVSISAGQARIELRSSAQRPPTQVDLALAWPGSSLSLRLTQPFPASGGRFVGAEGQPLPGAITVSMVSAYTWWISIRVHRLSTRSPLTRL
jgi:hypothetical protein